MKNFYAINDRTSKAFTSVLFLLFFVFFTASAQTNVTIGGAGVAVNGPFDIADANYVGTGDIYLSTEIATSGTITALEWNNFSCPPSITIPVKIYLKLIPTATTTWATETYATAISGATLVYSGSATFNANGFANGITLTTPFAYTTANNLEVITEADNGSTNQNEPSWYYNTNVSNSDCSWYSASQGGLSGASNSTGGIDQYRPSIRLTMTTCTAPTISSQPSTTPQTVCLNGATTALSVTATGTGTLTYQWYQNATNANTGGTLIAGATSSSYAPLSTSVGALYYYCVVNNGCTTISNTSGLVTVNGPPAMPGAITGPASVCNLSSNTYSVALVTGATSYTWILPSGWSGTSTTNSIIATEGTGGGTISVTAGNTCGNSTAQTTNITLTVPPITPAAIIGPDSVCANSTNTFSVTAVNGATSYTWTLPTGWSGTSTTSSIQATEGTGQGSISVTADNFCGNSSPQTLAVTLASPPGTLGAITGVDSGCANSQITYSVSPVSGATFYNWTLPNGWSGSSTTNSIQATLGTTGGNVMVTANNACGGTAAQSLAVNVVATPAMPGTINGPNTVCTTTPYTYSIAPVSGATSYTWTLPGTWTGSSTTDSIVATVGASGGTISVTAGGFCGNSPAQTLAVSLGSAPAMPAAILGPMSVCSSSSNNTFTVNAVNGATSYTWTLPNGWSGTSTTSTIIVTAGSAAGSISVTANNACGSSTAQTLAVGVVAAAPSMPGNIAQAGLACNGGTDTFSVASVNNASSYTWTLPNTWSGTSTTNNIIATAGNGGGSVSVTANNACGSSTAQTLAVTLGTVPATPGSILGPDSVCASSSNNTYSVNSVGGATSYTWTLPNGWSGSSTTQTIVTTAGSSGGAITVTANNACGSSSPVTFAVTVAAAAPATPGTILQGGQACTGSIDTFSVATVSGATSYTWTFPNTWTGSSTTNTIISNVGLNGGAVTVTANNACGSSAAQTLPIIWGSAPNMPGTISGPDTVCASSSNNTFAINTVNGATSYIWTLPSGWSGTSTTAAIVTTAGSTGGTISVMASNGCATSAAQTLAVTISTVPATPGSISGLDSVCAGSPGFYGVFAVSGATSYTWTLPNDWSGTSTTQTISPTVGNTSGNVSVTANNTCGSSAAQSLNVVVKPTPQVSYTYSGGAVCNNMNPIVTLSGGTPAGGTYSGQGVTGTTFNATTLSAGNYTVTYSYTNAQGCGASDSATIAVQVCIGIATINAAEVSVYPNPFNDAIIIDTKGNYGNGTATLLDVTGREVNRVEFAAGAMSVQLNTTSLAKGAYLLNIIVEGKLVTVKKLVRVE